MPVTEHAVLARGVDREAPQPQPTSSTRSPVSQRRAWCRPARAWRAAPPRASSRRARRSRSCRSSTRRGTARRTRSRRRSGGGPSAGRAAIAVAAPLRAQLGSPAPAAAAASRRPHARRRAIRRLARASIGGGLQLASSASAASMSSTSSAPLTYARPRPSWPGARSDVAERLGRATRKVGPPRRWSAAARCRPTASTGTGGRAGASASSGAVVASVTSRALAAWRSGLMRTTSQARPVLSSTQITHAEGSNCQRRSPCPAEVGNAWWLLCQASPNVKGASHARLRDSSPVSNACRPKKWHSELML